MTLRRLFPLLLFAGLPAGAFSLLTWNLSGNGAADWSTNAPQVQAIGRLLRHLDPDVAAFQEVPFALRAQMPGVVRAFLPGHFYVQNSGTDGVLMSGLASRFPVRRSQKWLDGAALGGGVRFTRDVFEAELAVPHFPAPVHVFTTHLKSGQTGANVTNRFLEALAVSNLLVNTFLPAHPGRAYALVGDFNEDHASPPNARLRAVTALTNGTGLRLTTPRNPASGREWTLSIRDRLDRRYDYVLPGGPLAALVATGIVFRSDTLAVRPPGLERADSAAASDHLPVMLWFRHAEEPPFALTSAGVVDGVLSLAWEATPGRRYRVLAGDAPAAWQALPELLATGPRLTWRTNLTAPAAFFQIERRP
jgi:endonuclease/exonuclease/phosphatase family metal-dependent hydrolase